MRNRVRQIIIMILALAMGLSAASVTVFAGSDPAGSLELVSQKGLVKLDWDGAEGAASYRVLRRVPGGHYEVIGETEKSKFRDKSCRKERYYLYKVKAYNEEGKRILTYKARKVFVVTTDPKKKMVALTFDDGPGKYTSGLVKSLKKHHARATFFVVGSNIKPYHKAMTKAYDAGCEIGNHSYGHEYLTDISFKKAKSSIKKTDKLIEKYTGYESRLLRPPYGATSGKVAKAVKKPQILWSIDTLDWKTRSKKATISAVMNNVKDGDVILIHDIHKPSVEAAKELIPKLQKKGYQLVTVSELAKYKGKKLKNGKVYGRIH